MAGEEGYASAEGLGPGVAEAFTAARKANASKKPASEPDKKKQPEKAPQYADAPYKMAADSGDSGTEA